MQTQKFLFQLFTDWTNNPMFCLYSRSRRCTQKVEKAGRTSPTERKGEINATQRNENMKVVFQYNWLVIARYRKEVGRQVIFRTNPVTSVIRA